MVPPPNAGVSHLAGGVVTDGHTAYNDLTKRAMFKSNERRDRKICSVGEGDAMKTERDLLT